MDGWMDGGKGREERGSDEGGETREEGRGGKREERTHSRAHALVPSSVLLPIHSILCTCIPSAVHLCGGKFDPTGERRERRERREERGERTHYKEENGQKDR